MRKLLVVSLLLLGACSSGTEGDGSTALNLAFGKVWTGTTTLAISQTGSPLTYSSRIRVTLDSVQPNALAATVCPPDLDRGTVYANGAGNKASWTDSAACLPYSEPDLPYAEPETCFLMLTLTQGVLTLSTDGKTLNVVGAGTAASAPLTDGCSLRSTFTITFQGS